MGGKWLRMEFSGLSGDRDGKQISRKDVKAEGSLNNFFKQMLKSK